jgi:hypothetical protein
MSNRQYKKYEFCIDVNCPMFHHIELKCLVDESCCIKTAKQFHKWLKNNNFIICKKWGINNA